MPSFWRQRCPGLPKPFIFQRRCQPDAPGGGEPFLSLPPPEVQAWFTCVFGPANPLIPNDDHGAIGAPLHQADPLGQRSRFVEYAGADHGFMCEARSSFHPKASAQGWRLLLGEEPLF